ncbi:MAG TPA: iron-containing redox enzyme family protein [Solirubrobacteraceae bacterium]|nr:iron-containing redox enzyme family protein [Solirubrobacteraceae bacterium]
MDFWSRLDAVAREHDVLRHPFYVRWSAGELSSTELAEYSGQYRHAVVALAEASARAAADADGDARAELAAHAAEEAQHVALWDRFIDAVGGERAAAPRPETAGCARAWSGEAGRSELATLVAVYAIEAAQPQISKTKREGLATHYGIDGPGVDYFELHERLDVAHAAAGRKLIDARLNDADHDALLGEAEAVLRANWRLLDGVEGLAA